MADGALWIYQTLLNQMIAGVKIIYEGETADHVHSVSGKQLTLMTIIHKFYVAG